MYKPQPQDYDLRRKSELACQRDKDLLRVFRQIREAHNIRTIKDGVARAIESPSSRFWVSSELTVKMISRIDRGDFLMEMRPLHREMFFELHRRFHSLKMSDEYKDKPALHICEIIVEQQAPKFYLCLGSAIKFIKRQRSIEQCRKIERLLR